MKGKHLGRELACFIILFFVNNGAVNASGNMTVATSKGTLTTTTKAITTTKATTITNATTTQKSTTFVQTTSSLSGACELRSNDCGQCVRSSGISRKCFWCPTTQKCQSYGLLPDSCGLQWYMGQCTLKGYWVAVVAPCLCLLLLVVLCCCCYCCCCRTYKNDGISGSDGEKDELLMNTRRKSERKRRQEYFEGRHMDQSRDNPPLRSYGLFNKNLTF